MKFGILGPLEVRRGEDLLRLGGLKQRSVLAVLLLHPNRVVPAARLVQLLWGEDPPATAAHSIHVYVSELRKALEAPGAPSSVLATQAAGYILRLERNQVDATRFEALLGEAESAPPARAAAILDEALALWRGPALSDFAGMSFAIGDAARLGELRQHADELRIEAGLALGRHRQLVGDLEAMLGEHPLRERLCYLLMLALYRSGRQAEASDVYQRTRTRLVEELGMEPGGDLQRLLRLIVNQDPSLEAAPREDGVGPGNLPRGPTTFIGRSEEKAAVLDLLRTSRLVTLVGPGGIGKTRLAIEVAREVSHGFTDGVWFIDLGCLDEPELLMQVAAIALGVRDRPKEELRETVIEFLRQRQTLLVLDNCEHMIPAAAAFSRLVLDNCPGVRVLATSREPTKVGGEKTLAVPSMALPDQHGSPSVDQMRRFAAVALFVERAASAGSFALNSDNSNDVIRVCRDLDGIPLAIELAARRTLALSVRQIAERLDDRFRLLKGGSDASLPRHRTLLAAMDWSYDLLTPEEQTVLRQSSLFAGTFDLEAVEAMCANGSLPVDAVDAMTELVAKSLVEANTAAPEARYRLLDTIRKYAYRRLDEAGELGEVRERYIDYYAALARELETIEYGLASGPHPSSPDQSFKRAGIELANVRAAVAYCGDSQRAVEAVEIATNFGKYWVHKGPLSEGELWLRESLRISSDIPTELEAEAILVMAQLALAKGDVDRSEKLHERSLSLFRELGDIGNIAVLLHDLGQVALFKGDPDRARRLSEEGLDLRRELGDSGPVAHALVGLSEVERYSGAYERARQLLNEALHLMEGQHDWLETTARAHLGMVALDEGDFDAGEHLIAESMATWRDRESRIDLAENLVCMAGVRAEQQDFPASAALLGAVAAELDATSAVLWPPIPRTREHYESVCRAELGDDAFQAAFNRGLALTVDEAIDFALKGTAQPDSQA